MPLKDDLQKIIKGEIWNDDGVLSKYSHDASLFEVKPQIIVAPKDSEDIQNLVKFANKHKNISLTVRAGGTDMTGGDLGESVIVDVAKHLNRIKEVGTDYAVAEPGVFYRDFEKETLKHNALLPSYPASREICTLGGMVANNSGGEKTLAYGKTEDYVTDLKVVLRDGKEYDIKPIDKKTLVKKMRLKGIEGQIYKGIYNLILKHKGAIAAAKPKVSKNSAGYYLWNVWDGQTFNLDKLLTGSQGTLGIITQIKVRLIKPKKHSRLLVIFMRKLGSLAQLINKVLEHKPESFESFDDNTLKLAFRYLPELIKLIKPKNLFTLAWQFLPEAWMVLTGGFPKLILIAEFTGDSEKEVAEKARKAQKDIAGFKLKTHITQSPEEARKYWTIRRESFNLLRHHLVDKRTAPFIDDMVVRHEQLPEFLPQLQKIMDQYDLVYTIAGHVGDANFHIIPLMDLRDKRTRVIIPKLADKVYKLVFKFGGSITGEHNDGLIRSPYLKEMYGPEIYELFKEVKKIFDPDNIFNPGKKVGSNLEYAMDHLAKGNPSTAPKK